VLLRASRGRFRASCGANRTLGLKVFVRTRPGIFEAGSMNSHRDSLRTFGALQYSLIGVEIFLAGPSSTSSKPGGRSELCTVGDL